MHSSRMSGGSTQSKISGNHFYEIGFFRKEIDDLRSQGQMRSTHLYTHGKSSELLRVINLVTIFKNENDSKVTRTRVTKIAESG